MEWWGTHFHVLRRKQGSLEKKLCLVCEAGYTLWPISSVLALSVGFRYRNDRFFCCCRSQKIGSGYYHTIDRTVFIPAQKRYRIRIFLFRHGTLIFPRLLVSERCCATSGLKVEYFEQERFACRSKRNANKQRDLHAKKSHFSSLLRHDTNAI